MKRKWLAVGIILLFIGVSVPPSINLSVVKASDDNDLVEVTTQACGIKGYGDTTVKLTREQYRNLEQYLVDFRARLNQTTTREKAVPIFKDAVVELDKFGLLPKGMSVETAKNLLTRNNDIQILTNTLEKKLHNHNVPTNESENHLCLIAGRTSETRFESPMTIFWYKLFFLSLLFYNGPISQIFISLLLTGFLSLGGFCEQNPFAILYRVSFGSVFAEQYTPVFFYASGWVSTLGLNGLKNWQGEMKGALPIEGTRIPFFNLYKEHYPGAVGFIGLKISHLAGTTLYLGSALWVKIGSEPPQ